MMVIKDSWYGWILKWKKKSNVSGTLRLSFWITSTKFHWIPWTIYVTCFGILWSMLLISISFDGITILLANQHRNVIYSFLPFHYPPYSTSNYLASKHCISQYFPPSSHSRSHFLETLCCMPGFLFWFENFLSFPGIIVCKLYIHCS